MLDLQRLRRIKLSARPVGQLIVGNLGLSIDYRLPRRTEIILEGRENLAKKGGVFLAMNHTDRYNYWPLQYAMYRAGLPFTATWVKGKYYENRLMGAFMDSMNNIPLPSRGYVIATEFRKAIGRAPNEAEYRVLRDLVDGRRAPSESPAGVSAELERFIGRDATPFLEQFNGMFRQMTEQVVELNRKAIEDLGLNVLVFPEGTRSRRLSQGRNGLAQMTQYLGATIVPIGCNGSDRIYPGNSPFSKGGRVVYRIGRPLTVDDPELSAFRVPKDVLPLTDNANRQHGERYSAITKVVMTRINELLDPEYQFASDESATAGTQGVDRFV